MKKTINGVEREIAPYADLSGANLSGASLSYADLSGADLHGASLSYADLSGANLSGAILPYANLHGANLYGADLRGANLRYASLRGADLYGAKVDDGTRFGHYSIVPEDGAFTGWKKALTAGGRAVVVKLRVPKKAARSNAPGGRKCRASSSRVVAIQNIDGTPHNGVARSSHDHAFIYRVGETVEPFGAPFDPLPQNECAPGIHFFITRQEAVEY